MTSAGTFETNQIIFKTENLTDGQIEQISRILKGEEEHVLPLTPESINEILDKNSAVVAIENNNVIGFIKFIDCGFSEQEERRIIEIGSWVVAPTARGRGIGVEMLKELVKLIREKYQNPTIVAIVQKSNKDSFDCLSHIGAREINKPDCLVLYPDGADEKDFYILEVNNIQKCPKN